MPRPLFALGLCVFTFGTTEFMISGLLPTLGSSLHVSVPTAGLLITGYALGVVVGAPLLTIATTRLARKASLVGLMAIFVAGSAISTVAGSFEVLMVGRIISALSHGAFFGIGATVATGLVTEDKRGRAIAIMFGGLTIASVLGVPLGTVVGEQLGWRATFAVVTGLAAIGLVAVWMVVPTQDREADVHLRRELSFFRAPSLWLALVTTVLAQGALFAAYSYISPLLTNVSGFASGTVPLLLMLFGAGTFLGSYVGGRGADRSLKTTLLVGLAALTGILLAIAALSSSQPLTVAAIVLFGIAGFSINPALQARVMSQADEAPTLASAANISAFNVGNAAGPWLGGLTISGGLGYTAPCVVGAILAAAALVPAGLAARR